MNLLLSKEQIENILLDMSNLDRRWKLIIVDEDNPDFKGDVMLYICGYSLNRLLGAENAWARQNRDTTNLSERCILANSSMKYVQKETLLRWKQHREESINAIFRRFLCWMITNATEYIDQQERFNYEYQQYSI